MGVFCLLPLLFGYVVVRYMYVAICCCLLGTLHVPRTRLYCCSFFLGMLHVAPRTRLYCCSFFLGMLLLVQGYIAVHSSWVCCSSYKAILLFVLLGYVGGCCWVCRYWVYCCLLSSLLGVLFVIFVYFAVRRCHCFVCFFSFMFDEPSSYLDVKQRLNAALAIRSLLRSDR